MKKLDDPLLWPLPRHVRIVYSLVKFRVRMNFTRDQVNRKGRVTNTLERLRVCFQRAHIAKSTGNLLSLERAVVRSYWWGHLCKAQI